MSAGISDAGTTGPTTAVAGTESRAPVERMPWPLVGDGSAVHGNHAIATMLVLEIDRWRLIHDLLGEQAADVVSRHLEQCARAALRPVDRCFRTGPGQYLILLPEQGCEDAERLVSVIRRGLDSRTFTEVGPMTLSGAIAQRFPGESVGQWWKRLDSTLAQAKAGGGDRVVVDRRRSDVDSSVSAPGLHLEWQAHFECGEPTIDRQHREILHRAQEVLEAARRSGPFLPSTVTPLLASLRQHFVDEEAILAKYGYPGLPRHAALHAQMFEKTQRLQAAVAAGRVAREDLLRFLLGEMVADHMLAEDRLFADLFQGKAGRE